MVAGFTAWRRGARIYLEVRDQQTYLSCRSRNTAFLVSRNAAVPPKRPRFTPSQRGFVTRRYRKPRRSGASKFANDNRASRTRAEKLWPLDAAESSGQARPSNRWQIAPDGVHKKFKDLGIRATPAKLKRWGGIRSYL